jgi:hypothetical protein
LKKNNSGTKDTLKKYFISNTLKGIENETDLVFEKKWSLLEGWKLNILKWESKIRIECIESYKIIIYQKVTTNGLGVITSIAFSSLFEKHIQFRKVCY